MESQPGMSFQKIVIIVAVVLLVITLTVIGYMLKGAIQNQPLITNMQVCPDKWTSGATGSTCEINIDSITRMYPNSGNFILRDLSCVWTDVSMVTSGSSVDTCFGTNKYWARDVSGSWIQGNTSNGLDATKIYLLASAETGHYSGTKPNNITYTPASFEENQKWAKAYNISWDGVN